MTYDTLIDMDPKKPYESMAKRLVYNINNGGAHRRIDAAISYAEKLHCRWCNCVRSMGMQADYGGVSQLAKISLEATWLPYSGAGRRWLRSTQCSRWSDANSDKCFSGTARGKAMIGYTCKYTPIELLYVP